MPVVVLTAAPAASPVRCRPRSPRRLRRPPCGPGQVGVREVFALLPRSGPPLVGHQTM